MDVVTMTNKQTILITGATGNSGGGAAVALAKRGARVVLLGHRLKTLEVKADSIRVALSEARIEYQDTDISTLALTQWVVQLLGTGQWKQELANLNMMSEFIKSLPNK